MVSNACLEGGFCRWLVRSVWGEVSTDHIVASRKLPVQSADDVALHPVGLESL